MTMAQFHSLPKLALLALVAAGDAIPGDFYFCSDSAESFLAITGTPNPAVAPLSSVILTGEYSLSGPAGPVGPAGPQGETGPAGPQGPGISMAQMIATAIALG
jgi:hypothetical protein